MGKANAAQSEIDRDDVPLAELRQRKQRRLDSSNEELDHCLSGSSVIDPLAIESWQSSPISSSGPTTLPPLEVPGAALDATPSEQQQQPESSPVVPLDGHWQFQKKHQKL